MKEPSQQLQQNQLRFLYLRYSIHVMGSYSIRTCRNRTILHGTVRYLLAHAESENLSSEIVALPRAFHRDLTISDTHESQACHDEEYGMTSNHGYR